MRRRYPGILRDRKTLPCIFGCGESDMSLRRVTGWETRLQAHFAHWRHEPFGWGANDCGTFAVGAVRAVDPDFAWSPDWTNEDEALRRIVRAGGIEALATSVLGAPFDGWKRARRGDIASFEEKGVRGLCVCTGRTLCGPGPGRAGLQHMPLRRGLKVWPIG
jgi:hypothetical protein